MVVDEVLEECLQLLNVVMVSSDQLKFGSSFHQSGAEKREIQERDSVPQNTEATKPGSTTDRKWRVGTCS